MNKVFVWSGKTRSSQYGDFYTISVKLSDLESYVNEKGYVSLAINKRKQPDNYGNDLSVIINDYKPKTEVKKNEFGDDELDSLPF